MSVPRATWTLPFLVVAFALAPGQAHPQEDRSRPICGEPEASGMIRGSLVPGPGGPRVQRAVWLRSGEEVMCSARPRPEGGFEFRNLSPGEYEIGMGALGLSPISDVSIRIDDRAVRVVIPIYREDRIQQCLSVEVCTRVLTTLLPDESASSEVERLELAGLRMAIVLAGRRWAPDDVWVACVSGDEWSSLGTVYPRVASSEDCFTPEQVPGASRQRSLHRPSGMPGRYISVHEPIVRADGTATLHVAFRTPPIGGEGHECTFRDVGGAWVPVGCRMEWIS